VSSSLPAHNEKKERGTHNARESQLMTTRIHYQLAISV
jgi:hypothetical protein